MGAQNTYTSSGCLTAKTIRHKVGALHNLADQIPERLDAQDSKVLVVVVQLLDRLVDRAHGKKNMHRRYPALYEQETK